MPNLNRTDTEESHDNKYITSAGTTMKLPQRPNHIQEKVKKAKVKKAIYTYKTG